MPALEGPWFFGAPDWPLSLVDVFFLNLRIDCNVFSCPVLVVAVVTRF